MGSASHKRAGSYIAVRTSLAVPEALKLAEEVALQVLKRRPDKPGPIVVTQRGEKSLTFTVVNIRRKAILRFALGVSSTEAETRLRSKITYFRTTQDKLLGIIPIGPKVLSGWQIYATFMESFELAIRDRDQAAESSIVVAAG